MYIPSSITSKTPNNIGSQLERKKKQRLYIVKFLHKMQKVY